MINKIIITFIWRSFLELRTWKTVRTFSRQMQAFVEAYIIACWLVWTQKALRHTKKSSVIKDRLATAYRKCLRNLGLLFLKHCRINLQFSKRYCHLWFWEGGYFSYHSFLWSTSFSLHNEEDIQLFLCAFSSLCSESSPNLTSPLLLFYILKIGAEPPEP